MSSKAITTVPFLKDILIENRPLPLFYVHWCGLCDAGLRIRQHVARPFKKGGLDFLLSQYENTQRGILTLRGIKSEKSVLLDKTGIDSWLKRLCLLINLELQGTRPLEHIRLARTTQEHLAYYAPFYSDQMELVIYIGSGTEIDEADVMKLPRSKVDIHTRNWERLLTQIPLELWVN